MFARLDTNEVVLPVINPAPLVITDAEIDELLATEEVKPFKLPANYPHYGGIRFTAAWWNSRAWH